MVYHVRRSSYLVETMRTRPQVTWEESRTRTPPPFTAWDLSQPIPVDSITDVEGRRCRRCRQDYTSDHPPVQLSCGHVLGHECFQELLNEYNSDQQFVQRRRLLPNIVLFCPLTVAAAANVNVGWSRRGHRPAPYPRICGRPLEIPDINPTRLVGIAEWNAELGNRVVWRADCILSVNMATRYPKPMWNQQGIAFNTTKKCLRIWTYIFLVCTNTEGMPPARARWLACRKLWEALEQLPGKDEAGQAWTMVSLFRYMDKVKWYCVLPRQVSRRLSLAQPPREHDPIIVVEPHDPWAPFVQTQAPLYQLGTEGPLIRLYETIEQWLAITPEFEWWWRFCLRQIIRLSQTPYLAAALEGQVLGRQALGGPA